MMPFRDRFLFESLGGAVTSRVILRLREVMSSPTNPVGPVLFGPAQSLRIRVSKSFVASLVLHLLVVGAMMYRPEPQLLRPSSSLKGNGGRGSETIALVAPGASVLTAPAKVDEEFEKKPIALLRREKKRKQKAQPVSEPQPAVAERNLKPGMPGFILGSATSGMASDHDVRIALPVIAPDPPIVRAKLPDWLRGDVIVEVTISETGDVVETVVLETVGYGLEQTVVETLRKWRWTPATIDGMKVASKQDVRFHFPS